MSAGFIISSYDFEVFSMIGMCLNNQIDCVTFLDCEAFFGRAKDESKLLFSASSALDAMVENKIDTLFIQYGSVNENCFILAALVSNTPCLMIQGENVGSADVRFENIRAFTSILDLRKTRRNIELACHLQVPAYESSDCSNLIVSNTALPPKNWFLKNDFFWTDAAEYGTIKYWLPNCTSTPSQITSDDHSYALRISELFRLEAKTTWPQLIKAFS